MIAFPTLEYEKSSGTCPTNFEFVLAMDVFKLYVVNNMLNLALRTQQLIERLPHMDIVLHDLKACGLRYVM